MKTTLSRIQIIVPIFQTESRVKTQKLDFRHSDSDTFDSLLLTHDSYIRTEFRQCRSDGGSDTGVGRSALSRGEHEEKNKVVVVPSEGLAP